MRDDQSQSEHVLSLASDLLDDIELGRLPTEPLLLKVTRLARLTGSEETKQWLRFELNGFSGNSDLCIKYMGFTGRWTDWKERRGYWHNLAGIESIIQSSKLELQGMRIPDMNISISSANPRQLVTTPAPQVSINQILVRASVLNKAIETMSQIKGKVLGLIHKFVSDVYHERKFSGTVQTVFERYKVSIDRQLAGRCGDVLEKFPAVYDRLAEGDPEAVSQALTTCRRIIDSFADSIFPAKDEKIEVEGQTVKLGQLQVLNRINAYVRERISSDSRRTKLRQSLTNLYNRTSSGVHGEVAQEEAVSLLLNVFLVLGEIYINPHPTSASPRLLQLDLHPDCS